MVLESFQSQGLPYHPDMFSTGDSPHGCGHVPRTVYKGDHTTAANYLLHKGSNLPTKTDTTVDKVILEGEGSDSRAAAVKIIEKDGPGRKSLSVEVPIAHQLSSCDLELAESQSLQPMELIARLISQVLARI
jgi:hypothetical protein